MLNGIFMWNSIEHLNEKVRVVGGTLVVVPNVIHHLLAAIFQYPKPRKEVIAIDYFDC